MSAMHQADSSHTRLERKMIGLIARWGHNVLLAGIALVTNAVLIMAK
jgi:hypothetical protein